MFQYLMASCGDGPDEAKVRLYCEGSVAHYDWLVAAGRSVQAGLLLRLQRRTAHRRRPRLVRLRARPSVLRGGDARAARSRAAARTPGGADPDAIAARRRRAQRCARGRQRALRRAGARARRRHQRRDRRVVRRDARNPDAPRRGARDGRLHQRRGNARGAPAAGAALQVPRRRRGRRRQRHQARDRCRCRDVAHGQGVDLAARHAAVGSQARHPRRCAGPALRERGRLLRSPRRVRALPPRRSRLADRGRRGLREARVSAQGRGRRRDGRRSRTRARRCRPAVSKRRSRSTTATPSAARTPSSTSRATT